jgi:hypothetical protein
MTLASHRIGRSIRHSGQRALCALIRNLDEFREIPGSPLRVAPE